MEVNAKLQTRHLSAADDKIQFKSTKKVAEQLIGCKGYSTLATGQFPLNKNPCTTKMTGQQLTDDRLNKSNSH